MGAQLEIVAPRYVVLTQLADSWIPRAAHANPANAEVEAFRWRRIYGPNRTRIAQLWIPDQPPQNAALSLPVQLASEPVDVTATPIRPGIDWQPWRDAALRALALYLGFGFANRAMELLILLAGQ